MNERLHQIEEQVAGHALDGAVIEPLNGKYYGTRISNPFGSSMKVWGWGRQHKPSDRELTEWDDADEPFETYDIHYEDIGDLATARLIIAAPALLAIARKLDAELQEAVKLCHEARQAISQGRIAVEDEQDMTAWHVQTGPLQARLEQMVARYNKEADDVE